MKASAQSISSSRLAKAISGSILGGLHFTRLSGLKGLKRLARLEREFTVSFFIVVAPKTKKAGLEKANFFFGCLVYYGLLSVMYTTPPKMYVSLRFTSSFLLSRPF